MRPGDGGSDAQSGVGPACTDVFQGTQPEGAACEGAEECQLGATGVACTSLEGDGSARTCRTLLLVNLGSPCCTDAENRRINSNAPNGTLPGHCGSGQYCKMPSSSTGTCAVLSAANEPCDAPEACATGLYCDTSVPAPACQPAK